LGWSDNDCEYIYRDTEFAPVDIEIVKQNEFEFEQVGSLTNNPYLGDAGIVVEAEKGVYPKMTLKVKYDYMGNTYDISKDITLY
jgi:hypothetical protein